MPVNQKKMAALKEEYGEEKGERVYYAMENKEKGKSKKKSTKKKSGAAKKALVSSIVNAQGY